MFTLKIKQVMKRLHNQCGRDILQVWCQPQYGDIKVAKGFILWWKFKHCIKRIFGYEIFWDSFPFHRISPTWQIQS